MTEDGRDQFLRKDENVYKLGVNALERIIARGLNRGIQSDVCTKPLLPLLNSQAQILCSDVDITTQNVAFGGWAISKLKTKLLHKDPSVSKRAIMALLDMVHDPKIAVEAIRLQVLPRLVRLMRSEDSFVRQHTLMILELLSLQPGGKLAIVNHHYIMKNMPILLNDNNMVVRLNAAKTIKALATWYVGVQELINQYFVSTVMNRLNLELDTEIMIILSETLELLLDYSMAAKKESLDNEGIELAILLEHPDSNVRAGGAAILVQLIKHPAGKKALLNHRTDILARLTYLLRDPEMKVRIHAAAALMFVLCTTEAKLRCLQLSTIANLLYCVHFHTEPGLQLNSLKALTSMAESPGGQDILKENFKLIENIKPADQNVQRHKGILLKVINRVV